MTIAHMNLYALVLCKAGHATPVQPILGRANGTRAGGVLQYMMRAAWLSNYPRIRITVM